MEDDGHAGWREARLIVRALLLMARWCGVILSAGLFQKFDGYAERAAPTSYKVILHDANSTLN